MGTSSLTIRQPLVSRWLLISTLRAWIKLHCRPTHLPGGVMTRSKLEMPTYTTERLAELRAFHPDSEDRPVAAGMRVYSVKRDNSGEADKWEWRTN
jgi:hypothetical protein